MADSLGAGDVVAMRSMRVLIETPVVQIQQSFGAGKKRSIVVLVLGTKADGAEFDAVAALKRLGWEPNAELAAEFAASPLDRETRGGGR